MSKMGGASGGGFFANLTPQDRAQMVAQVLQGATSSAMQSGSPLLAAVTPILSALIGGRAQSRANQWRQEQHGPVADELLGDNPQARRMMDILQTPGLPDPYRRIAQQRLDSLLAAAPSTRSPGGGGGGQRRISALSAFVDPETGQQMIVTRDGRVVPATGPDGQPFRRAGPAAAPETAAPVADPIAQAMTGPQPRVDYAPPGASPLAAPSLDDVPDQNDPLGLRRRPAP